MIKGIKFVADNLKSFIDLQIAFKSVEMYTDSQYVVKGMNDWRASWIKNNWKNSQKKQVLNMDLWKEVLESKKEIKEKGIELKVIHVYGHSGHVYNERADALCTAAATGEEIVKYKGDVSKYLEFITNS